MKEQFIPVLLVEDEVGYAYLLQAVLTNLPSSRFEITHVKDLHQTLQCLQSKSFNVVLLDLSLPDCKGLETYAAVKKAVPHLPVIVLTGSDDETLALQAVRDGAQDYLVKGQVDGKMLSRVIRYAIERKRSEETLRQSEEFYRLISENVTDLIAVIDRNGHRLYNSASYRHLLGDPLRLQGSDSFEEIHPEDRAQVRELFEQTVATGIGRRAEYRLMLKDGSVRYIESQGNAIRDEHGQPCKVVVVSRDITERRETVEILRNALSDLKKSHEELQASSHFSDPDKQTAEVLADMDQAVQRADGIIRGLVEFSAGKKPVIT